MALLIALTVISLIVALTLQFNKNMRQNLLASGIQSNRGKLDVMASSGVNLAMAVLLKDAKDNEHDSLQDSWALLADENLSKLFDAGLLTIKISDDNGKFQINSMVHSKNQQPEGKTPEQVIAQEKDARNILWGLLRQEPFNLEDGAARTIIDTLVDWMDSDDGDGEEEYGAESSYYLGLDTPYACKNGPVEFVEELLLVKGFTPELLFGTEKQPGLAALLTTQGNDGKININTADPLLLQALDEDMTKEMVEDMLAFRADKNNKDKLASPAWVAEALPFFTGQNTLKNITVKSHLFTIFSHARLDSTEKNLVATVQRDKQKVVLLSWKVE